MMNCSDCDGFGKITEEHMQRITAGRKLRDDRMARDMSLKEEATRLGISVVQLSNLEHGRVAAEVGHGN